MPSVGDAGTKSGVKWCVGFKARLATAGLLKLSTQWPAALAPWLLTSILCTRRARRMCLLAGDVSFGSMRTNAISPDCGVDVWDGLGFESSPHCRSQRRVRPSRSVDSPQDGRTLDRTHLLHEKLQRGGLSSSKAEAVVDDEHGVGVRVTVAGSECRGCGMS